MRYISMWIHRNRSLIITAVFIRKISIKLCLTGSKVRTPKAFSAIVTIYFFYTFLSVACSYDHCSRAVTNILTENKETISLKLHIYRVFCLVTNDKKLPSISSANYVSLHAKGASQSGPAMIVTVSPQWINWQPRKPRCKVMQLLYERNATDNHTHVYWFRIRRSIQ